jgi:tRNA-guanine transglycosylase
LAARTRSDQSLYGIVQGGAFAELRSASAAFIGALPFDGVAIGGSLGKSKADMHSVLDWSFPYLPAHWPRHLLGIGEPEDLFSCVARGVDQFDCVAPTRLGRHGQLYTASGKLLVTRPEFAEDASPIEEGCGCYTCRTGFSKGYLRHLFAANELLGYTLASLHNLYFILDLMQRIREAVQGDYLFELEREFLSRYH